MKKKIRPLRRVREICKERGTNTQSTYTLIRRGEIKVVRLGRAIYIHPDEVDRVWGAERDEEEKTA